jgi:hypothetical protein
MRNVAPVDLYAFVPVVITRTASAGSPLETKVQPCRDIPNILRLPGGAAGGVNLISARMRLSSTISSAVSGGGRLRRIPGASSCSPSLDQRYLAAALLSPSVATPVATRPLSTKRPLRVPQASLPKSKHTNSSRFGSFNPVARDGVKACKRQSWRRRFEEF